jgi:preprotein translocase subunit SecG
MYTVLTIFHFFVCSFLILVVLLQAGKGGGMGIAFGGGGSQTVFGSSGAGNFLTRLTAGCATAFFLNSMLLAYMSSRQDSSRLQTMSQRKAAEKAQQQAATDKVAKDLEKARQEIDKNNAAGKAAVPAPGTTPPGATTTPAAGTTPSAGTTPEATKAAPAAAPATNENEGDKAAPVRAKKGAAKGTKTPAPAENNPPPAAPTP